MPSADSISRSIRQTLEQMREYDRVSMVSEIQVTPFATKTVEDWKNVRSPGRAARRRAKHPQRIRIQHGVPCMIRVGSIMMIHPEMWKSLVLQYGPLKHDPYVSFGTSIFGIPVKFHANV